MRPDSLVTRTKILVPRRRSSLLTRQRLIHTLSNLLDEKLILVVAPPGYGKTSSIIDLAHHTEWPFCWYSLDPLDREPQRFLANFIAAIALQFPAFGKRSNAILQNMSQGDLNLESMLSVVVNDIYENISEHFVLVLDDYHQIDSCDPVTYFLNRFIQEVDDNCHIVLCSRSLISLPDLTLMVSRGQVGGLGQDELAFQPEELQRLLKQNFKRTISESEATRLSKETGGWVTGLLLSSQLVDSGLQEQARLGQVAGAGLFDYLARQVFERQPRNIQDFLLRTSLFETFDATLCKEVIGEGLHIQENWGKLIDTLIRSNLFVQPVGEEQIWLRYHSLFQAFLMQRMQAERPVEVEKLLDRLAEVYNQRGEWERTYELLKGLGRSEAIAGLIQQFGSRMITDGRIITLKEWIDALPPATVHANPLLLSLKGAALSLQGSPRPAVEQLSEAVEKFDPQKDRHALTETLLRRGSARQMMGEYQEALQDANRALELWSDPYTFDELIAEAHRSRGIALYRVGNLKEALQELEKSLELFKKIENRQRTAMLWLEIGNIHKAMGNYVIAEHSYTCAIEQWEQTRNAMWLSNVWNNLGDMQRLMADYEKAIQSLEKSAAYAQESGYLRAEAYSLATLGDLYSDLDAIPQAVDAFSRSRLVAQRVEEKFLLVYLDLAEAVQENRRGNFFQTQKLLRSARKTAEEDRSNFEIQLCNLESGHILVVNQQYSAAVPLITQAEHFFRSEGHASEALKAGLYLVAARYGVHNRMEDVREGIASILNQSLEITALMPVVRELRPIIEKMSVEKDLTQPLGYLLGEYDRYDQALLQIRRRLRRQTTMIPFALPHMNIQAFGKVEVKVNNTTLGSSDWQTQTSRDLFFFLLAHPEGLSKEIVGQAFWPDSTPAELKMRFKNAIYRMRRAVGKDAVVFQDEIYFFDTRLDYEYDVETFLREINLAKGTTDTRQKIKHYQAAMKAYQGAYMPDGELTWILIERQRLTQIYIQSLMALAELYLTTQEHAGALNCCRLALNEDPCLEEGHRTAMRIFAAAGDRVGVIRQYELCQQALREDLNTTPSPKTIELFEQLTGKNR